MTTILPSFGYTVFDLLPDEFDVSNATGTGFDSTINSQSTSCSISGASFTCSGIQVSEAFSQGVINFTVDALIGLSGTIVDSDNVETEMEAEFLSCSGSSCALMMQLVSLPCTVNIESDGQY